MKRDVSRQAFENGPRQPIGATAWAVFQGLAAGCALAGALLSIDARGAGLLSEWQSRTSPLPDDARVRSIAYGNDRFVAVTYADGQAITSSDGSQWELQSTAIAGTTRKTSGIAFGNGIFVAVGTSGNIQTTPDGVTWTPQESGTTAHFNGIAFVNDRFLALGDSGTILSSPNGITWTPHNTSSSNKWYSVTYANGLYVATGYRTGQAARIAVATEPGGWTVADTGYSMYMNGVAFGAGKFVCVGYAGAGQTSTDGLDWSEPLDAAPGNWLRHIINAGNTFVAVGENGIAVSTNGTDWEPAFRSGYTTIEGVAFNGQSFVAVGDEGIILQSSLIPQSSEEILLTDPERSGGDFVFKFTGEVGTAYQIQSTTNMVDWVAVQDVHCTTAQMSCTLENQNSSHRFYRVTQP